MKYTLLSLDLSSSCCGYVYFVGKSFDSYGYVSYSNVQGLHEKVLRIDGEIGHLIRTCDEIVLEKFLLYFSKGRSSARTITQLSEFNGYFQGFSFGKYQKICQFVNHVQALRYFIPKYDSLCRQKNYKSLSYKSPNVSVSKLIAFDFFLQHHPSFLPKLNKKNDKLIKENFDISDAFINGKYYLETQKISFSQT